MIRKRYLPILALLFLCAAATTQPADDSPALQLRIDKARAGSTVKLEQRTYHLSKGVYLHKAIVLDVNFADLKMTATQYPHNNHIAVETKTELVAEWEEEIKAGQAALAIVLPKAPCMISLGTDPHDPREDHYVAFCEDGRLSEPVPWNINGRRHRLYRCPLGIVDGAVIKNANFSASPGVTPDRQIVLHRVRNARVRNIGGDIYGINVTDSRDVSIDHIRGRVRKVHPSGGVVLGTWQTDGLICRDVVVTTSADLENHDANQRAAKPVFFAESWARNILLDNWDVTLERSETIWPGLPFIFTAGATRNFAIGKLTVRTTGHPYIVDHGSQPGDHPTIGELVVHSPNQPFAYEKALVRELKWIKE